MIVLPFTSITAGDIKEVFHLVETAVLHIHILYKTTAVGIGLDEDAALAIARIVAVFYNHVSHTCRHFASYHHSVQSLEMAVADNDVLRRHLGVPSVIVASALDRHVVVAVVKLHAFYQYIARALWVYSVVVHKFGIITQIAADDVLALQQMHTPERRVGNLYSLNGYALTVVQLQELWAQPVTLTELAVLQCHLLMIHLAAQVFVKFLFGSPLGKSRHGVSVDGSLADNGYIMASITIDEGRIVIEESSLPTGANHGIILLLGGKLQCGALLQFDTDIAGQHDRSLNIIGTRGNHNFCSLHGRSFPDGLGKGSPAVSLSIVLSSQPADKQSLFCYFCTGNISKDTVAKSYPLLLYGRRQMTGIFVLGMRM